MRMCLTIIYLSAMRHVSYDYLNWKCAVDVPVDQVQVDVEFEGQVTVGVMVRVG